MVLSSLQKEIAMNQVNVIDKIENEILQVQPEAMPKAKSEKIDFIDGLRGWASITVLLFHVFGCLLFQNVGIKCQKYIFLHGPMAVLIFFILSGFSLSVGLLKKLYLNNSDFQEVLFKKVIARYFRLAIPCFFASLCVFIIVKLNLSYYHFLPEKYRFEWWTYAYSNLNVNIKSLFSFSFFDVFFPKEFIPVDKYQGLYYITNLWTMSLEYFGSLLVFFYVLIVSKAKNKWSIYIPGLMFFAFFNSYYSYFIGGILMSELYIHKYFFNFLQNRIKEIFFIKLIYLFDIFVILMLIKPDFCNNKLLYCFLLVFCIMNAKLTKAFFECRLSKYFGKISFSIYLMHIPVLISFTSYLLLKNLTFSVYEKILYIGIPSILISLILAHFFTYIDQFGIKVGRIISDKIILEDNNKINANI